MQKNTSATTIRAAQARGLKNVRTLVSCALLAAVAVVLARLIIPMPSVDTRFSIEAVPIFLAGMLFGPLPGMIVGFVEDLVGCLFSGYGYNPLFCIPPILYGLCGGLFRPMLAKDVKLWKIALAFLPAVLFGSIGYQSFALAKVYNMKGAFMPSFVYQLTKRSIQFGITYVLDVLLVWLLYKSKVLTAAKVWPPVLRSKKQTETAE